MEQEQEFDLKSGFRLGQMAVVIRMENGIGQDGDNDWKWDENLDWD